MATNELQHSCLAVARLQGLMDRHRPGKPDVSDPCSGHSGSVLPAIQSPRYYRVTWAALIIDKVLFGIELAGGLRAGSVSLLANAIDFFGDAATMATGRTRSRHQRVDLDGENGVCSSS